MPFVATEIASLPRKNDFIRKRKLARKSIRAAKERAAATATVATTGAGGALAMMPASIADRFIAMDVAELCNFAMVMTLALSRLTQSNTFRAHKPLAMEKR